MKIENLRENPERDIEALEILQKEEKPLTAKEIYKKSEVIQKEYKKHRYLAERLSKHSKESEESKEALILKINKGRGKPNRFKLTKLGERKIRDLLVFDAKKLDKTELSFSSQQDRINTIVEYLEESDYMQQQVKKVELSQNFVEIDYKRLEKFSIDLAEDLINNPKQSEEAWKKAVTKFVTREQEESIEIRINNVYDIDAKTINEIESRDLNKLTMVQGLIKNVSSPQTELDSAIFECQQCCKRYEKEQDSNKLKSPYKCDCGCKKFSQLKKHHKTVRMVSLKSKPGQQTTHDFLVKLVGSLAEDKYDIINNVGQQVTVVGHLDTKEESRNTMTLDFYMKANNIILEENKWEEPEISSEREKEIRALQKEQGENISDHLARSMGSEKFYGNLLYREGLQNWILGKTENFGNLNILVVGDPGTAKTHIAKELKQGFGKIIDSVATGASGVGLTAAVRRDEQTGDYVAEAGALPMADGGFHITDEADKLDDSYYKHYNEALSDGSISIDKAGISVKLPADVSELSIANPKDRKFSPEAEKYKQIPIEDEDLLSRYGIIIGIEANRFNGKEENRLDEGKKFWKIMSRSLDREIEPPEDIREDIEREKNLTRDALVFDYLHYASQIDPDYSKEAMSLLHEVYLKLWGEQDEAETMIETRTIEAMAALGVAYARKELSDTVEERHIRQALEFIRKCYESVDFQIGKDDFSKIGQNPTRKLDKVRKAIEELTKNSSDNQVEVEKVIEYIKGFSDSDTEECIEKLKNEGEIFEPKSGYIQRT